jgi:hypothetical protein
MTAICSVCGSTDIRQKKAKQRTVYICATQNVHMQQNIVSYTPLPARRGQSTYHFIVYPRLTMRTRPQCVRNAVPCIYVCAAKVNDIGKETNIQNVRQAQEKRKEA